MVIGECVNVARIDGYHMRDLEDYYDLAVRFEYGDQEATPAS